MLPCGTPEEGREFKYLVEGHHVIVPVDIPLDLELRLIGAVKSFMMGLKSIDRVLDKNRDVWRSQIERGRATTMG